MLTTGMDNRARYGMACTECNNLLVAPKWSAYVSNHEVIMSGLARIAVERWRWRSIFASTPRPNSQTSTRLVLHGAPIRTAFKHFQARMPYGSVVPDIS
jgi:hypothetical protein